MVPRMIRRIKRVSGLARGQQTSMPGEKMFESQVGNEMALRRGHAIVVIRPIAREHQRLRRMLPLQALYVELPQVPLRGGNIRTVCIQVLQGQRRNLRRSVSLTAQVPRS